MNQTEPKPSIDSETLGKRCTDLSLERLTAAVVHHETMVARALVHEAAGCGFDWLQQPPPQTHRTEAAALLLLFAHRQGRTPPAWVSDVTPLAAKHFFVRRRPMQKQAEQETPSYLRALNIYAPRNFLLVC